MDGAAFELMKTVSRLKVHTKSLRKNILKCQYAETNISSPVDREVKLEESACCAFKSYLKFKLIWELLIVSI